MNKHYEDIVNSGINLQKKFDVSKFFEICHLLYNIWVEKISVNLAYLETLLYCPERCLLRYHIFGSYLWLYIFVYLLFSSLSNSNPNIYMLELPKCKSFWTIFSLNNAEFVHLLLLIFFVWVRGYHQAVLLRYFKRLSTA